MIKNIKSKIQKLHCEGRAFIDGQYVDAFDGRVIDKVSPIDSRKIPEISACGTLDIDIAVNCSLMAYKNGEWVNKPLSEKKKIILRLAFLVEQHIEELALLDTLETGRCIKNYYCDSIPKAIEAMRWFAEASDKIYEKATRPQENYFAVITREPLGVVGIITPWNDPLVVAFWKLTPALLMGNSVVLKPAEQSSYSILKVAKLALEAGIPKGVFNVVPGYGEEAGKALALHDKVRGIFFTGSTDVGKLILQYAGQSNMKKVGLECGGKSPFIVSDKSIQLEKAAKVLAKNIFYNQGQICSAPSRLLINAKIKQDFLPLLVSESRKYIPDDPLSFTSEVGAVISKKQKTKIKKYIEDGVNSGARIITEVDDTEPIKGGFYLRPVIFDEVNIDSRLVKEEIFGPVLVVITVNNIQEAITIANSSRYGLAASIWTDDYNEAYQVSRLLKAGIVHINSYGDDDNMIPFGGIKESGLGKDKSVYAFDEYSTIKSVCMGFSPIKSQ